MSLPANHDDPTKRSDIHKCRGTETCITVTAAVGLVVFLLINTVVPRRPTRHSAPIAAVVSPALLVSGTVAPANGSNNGVAALLSTNGRLPVGHFRLDKALTVANLAATRRRRCLLGADRIVFMGDSLTFGNGAHVRPVAPDETGGNFPMRVAQLAASYIGASLEFEGETCRVNELQPLSLTWKALNFGSRGMTATDGIYAYVRSSEYREAMRAVRDSTVLVLLLGTNDSRDVVWRGEAALMCSLLKLIVAIRKANPSIIIVLMTPPAAAPLLKELTRTPRATAAFGIVPAMIREKVRPSLQRFAHLMQVGQQSDFSLAMANVGGAHKVAVSQWRNEADWLFTHFETRQRQWEQNRTNSNPRAIYFLDLYEELEFRWPEFIAAGKQLESGSATSEAFELMKQWTSDGVHPKVMFHNYIAEIVFSFLMEYLR